MSDMKETGGIQLADLANMTLSKQTNKDSLTSTYPRFLVLSSCLHHLMQILKPGRCQIDKLRDSKRHQLINKTLKVVIDQ